MQEAGFARWRAVASPLSDANLAPSEQLVLGEAGAFGPAVCIETEHCPSWQGGLTGEGAAWEGLKLSAGHIAVCLVHTKVEGIITGLESNVLFPRGRPCHLSGGDPWIVVRLTGLVALEANSRFKPLSVRLGCAGCNGLRVARH